jgi:hypothetical protein
MHAEIAIDIARCPYTLHQSYADPLRKFARRTETMIIPVYDAKVMFANIDAVVEAAERFYSDLQEVDLTGRARDRNIGDVCLHHVGVPGVHLSKSPLRTRTFYIS